MDKNNSFGADPIDWALLQPNIQLFTLRQYFAESEKYWSKELSIAEGNLPNGLDYLVGLTSEGMRKEACLLNTNLLRESFVITLHSFIEKQLHEICKALIIYTDSNLTPDRNGYLKASQEMIKKICGFTWNDFDPEWQFIYSKKEGLRGIRNAYVHSTGEQSLSEREDLVKKILKKHTGKEELDSEYINLALKQTNHFFEKLRDKVWHSSAGQNKHSQEPRDT